MLEGVADGVKRRYISTRRDEDARRTRVRIRDAAARLFVQQGYVATSVRQIADAAGVGLRTVFSVYTGGKAQLFSEALDVALGGDDTLTPLAQRPTTLAALTEQDTTKVLEAIAALSSDLYDRAGPLIAAYQGSAGADPDMRRQAEMGLRGATELMHAIGRDLHTRQVLQPGLTPERAGDILLALCSPQTHQLLRHHRGWTSAEYRGWLTASMQAALVTRGGDDHTPPVTGTGGQRRADAANDRRPQRTVKKV
jgi:AcrR family transcriptional regulator